MKEAISPSSQTPSAASHLGLWNQYIFQLVKGQLNARSQQEKGKWQLEQDDCGQYPEAAPAESWEGAPTV